MRYGYINYFLTAFVLLVFIGNTNAQRNGSALFTYIQNPVLNETQQQYADAITNDLIVKDYHFMAINTDLLKEETSRLSFNIPGQDLIRVNRNKSYQVKSRRLVWTGKTDREHEDIVFVVKRDIVNATLNLHSGEWTIYPLTEGLHIMFNRKDAKPDQCDEEDAFIETRPAIKYSPFDPGDDRAKDDNFALESMAAECNIRIMVVFTQAAKTALADVTNTAELWIANWNTSNGNSVVDYNAELARVKVTNYVETGAAFNHPTYGNDSEDMIRLYEPADGFMDEMLGLRNQYDADMVTMIATLLHSGTGEALPIGAVAADAFNIVKTNAGGLTMAHEHGHLFGNRHSHDTNNSPYAYGHGWDVNNNFATVMAYTSQCSPCSRIFNWSNPSVNGGSPSVPTGTAAFGNAARVNRERDAAFSNFQAAVTNKNLFQGDTLYSEEMVDLYAHSTITTDGELIVLNSGSEGTFRAADAITFTPGFHAKSGSVFEARLEMACNALNLTSNDPPGSSAFKVDIHDDENDTHQKEIELNLTELSLSSYPNPFSATTTIAYTVAKT